MSAFSDWRVWAAASGLGFVIGMALQPGFWARLTSVDDELQRAQNESDPFGGTTFTSERRLSESLELPVLGIIVAALGAPFQADFGVGRFLVGFALAFVAVFAVVLVALTSPFGA